jgi:hypothetical protein
MLRLPGRALLCCSPAAGAHRGRSRLAPQWVPYWHPRRWPPRRHLSVLTRPVRLGSPGTPAGPHYEWRCGRCDRPPHFEALSNFARTLNISPKAPEVLLFCVQVQGLPGCGCTLLTAGTGVMGVRSVSRSPPHSGQLYVSFTADPSSADRDCRSLGVVGVCRPWRGCSFYRMAMSHHHGCERHLRPRPSAGRELAGPGVSVPGRYREHLGPRPRWCAGARHFPHAFPPRQTPPAVGA